MKKIIILVLAIISTNIHSYNDRDLDKLTKGERNLRYTDLSHCDLSYKYLHYVDMQHAVLNGSNFYLAYLKNTNLEDTRLYFIRNLSSARSVKNLNVKNAEGLTNKQKQFLRENGAINVPEDEKELSNEEMQEIILNVLEAISNGSKATYNWLKMNSNKILTLLKKQ